MLVCLHFFYFLLLLLVGFFLLFSGQTVSKLISNRLADATSQWLFSFALAVSHGGFSLYYQYVSIHSCCQFRRAKRLHELLRSFLKSFVYEVTC